MPRKLSSIAPDWWDYTTLEDNLIRDAAALTQTDLEQLSRPGFRVVMHDTLEDFYLAEALEYIDAWRQASPLVTRVAGEGKRCAPCASWSLVVGSRVRIMCGEWRGENIIFAGARFIFPARPNSGYFRSLHFLRLFRMTWFSELAGKILHLRRSQYEFNLKISVKFLTFYSLLSYVGAL